MKFTFNETQLINLLMWESDKYKFTKRLINYDNIIEDKELKSSLQSLVAKVKKMEDNEIKKLFDDRQNYKTTTFPQYELK